VWSEWTTSGTCQRRGQPISCGNGTLERRRELVRDTRPAPQIDSSFGSSVVVKEDDTTAMLAWVSELETSRNRGRTLAFLGGAGSLGVVLLACRAFRRTPSQHRAIMRTGATVLLQEEDLMAE